MTKPTRRDLSQIPSEEEVAKDPKKLVQPLLRIQQEMRGLLGLSGGASLGAVTWEQLLRQGIARPTAPRSPGGPAVVVLPDPEVYEPDFTPPPTPPDLDLTALMAGFIAEFPVGAYTQGHGPLRTNIYVAQRDPATDPALTTFSDATRLYEATHPLQIAFLTVEPGTRVHVWIKYETVDGVESVTPAGGTNGAIVTVGKIDGAEYFLALSIGTALIGNLAVTNAKINDVSAAKISAGAIDVGSYIRSPNYVSGSTGWNIPGNGNAEFSGVVVRGTVYANAGLIGGIVIGLGDIRSSNFVPGSAGFRASDGGTIEANNLFARGAIYGGAYGATFAWPAGTGTGFHLGPSGLLLGNPSTGSYFEVDYNGNLYAPGFSIVAGAATFGGALAAASGTFVGALSAATGTFSGTLTSDAVNAVSTINLQGESVRVARGDSASAAISITSGWTTVATAPAIVMPTSNGGTSVRFVAEYGCPGFDPGEGTNRWFQPQFRLLRNGSQIWSGGKPQGGFFNPSADGYHMEVLDSPGAGAWTYSLQVSSSHLGSGAANVGASMGYRVLVVDGAKR